MLREIPYMIGLMFFMIMLVLISGYYYQNNYKQDAIVQGLNETVRAVAINNVDYSSRIESGSVYIQTADFEKEVKEKAKKNLNVKLSKDAIFQFDYLKSADESIKAIRVIVKDKETSYQSTTKVNISDS